MLRGRHVSPALLLVVEVVLVCGFAVKTKGRLREQEMRGLRVTGRFSCRGQAGLV